MSLYAHTTSMTYKVVTHGADHHGSDQQSNLHRGLQDEIQLQQNTLHKTHEISRTTYAAEFNGTSIECKLPSEFQLSVRYHFTNSLSLHAHTTSMTYNLATHGADYHGSDQQSNLHQGLQKRNPAPIQYITQNA